jgi:hypothetical protein
MQLDKFTPLIPTSPKNANVIRTFDHGTFHQRFHLNGATAKKNLLRHPSLRVKHLALLACFISTTTSPIAAASKSGNTGFHTNDASAVARFGSTKERKSISPGFH